MPLTWGPYNAYGLTTAAAPEEPPIEPQETFHDGDIIFITRQRCDPPVSFFRVGDMATLVPARDRRWRVANFSGFQGNFGHSIATVCNNGDDWVFYRYRHATNQEIAQRMRR